jgi:ribonucleoside-diphosphate reductase alpha chain
MNIIMDLEDTELLYAKTGNWRQTHPWRARSNNSVGLLRHRFDKTTFDKLVSINEGDNDIGFVFMSHEDEMFNPCYEIGFNFYEQIRDKQEAVFQFCNLNELNASACVDEHGRFSEAKFYDLCRKAAILGTLQAGYTEFPYLGMQTEHIVRGEALLGISVTGWMTRPELFNEEILRKGAEIVKLANREVAKLIGINPAARTTTVKPSGNASVILKTASGIHPEHSRRYFRIMQLNKESETAKYLEAHYPEMLEESLWSNTHTDYVVYVPCENDKEVILKDEMQGVEHLKLIELVQNSWVAAGKNEELCYNKLTNHNVSNTVIIDNHEEVVDYIFRHQDNFSAVSFLSVYGDKDYAQAPFTSVLNTEELVKNYGDAAIFMSGLIVDGLHYFNNDLWTAVRHASDPNLPMSGTRSDFLLKKDWVRRVRQFAVNYFDGDLTTTIYCMKNVHLWHKWVKIQRNFELPDFVSLLNEPEFIEVTKTSAVACAGGVCEI